VVLLLIDLREQADELDATVVGTTTRRLPLLPTMTARRLVSWSDCSRTRA